MGQPKIKIKLNIMDVIIEVIGFLAILCLILLPLYHYESIPEEIPRHYGLDGKPDAYDSKNVLYTLPAIGVIMYIALSILNRFPHLFNYAVSITKENAKAQYKNASKLIRYLNTFLAIVFLYITHSAIQTAYGNKDGLGEFFIFIFLFVITEGIIFFLLRSFERR